MSHAQQIKEQDATTRARLLGFLGEEESWVTELISDLGNDWLESLYGTARARERAAYSKEFWAWWNNQWAITDAKLSARLRVDKAGVMHYSRDANHTGFIHSHGEFQAFYAVHHQLQINRLAVPAELAARWVATGQKPQ
ncbi:hypothetical protein GCM10023185_14700 [Hymenobacter saemangeumensis]|uniref:Uncharacterized protein n=1 Tax=Hymenobacter saemangeumensis TaxID=1084522 RepID=A0ABP8I936_9BACT